MFLNNNKFLGLFRKILPFVIVIAVLSIGTFGPVFSHIANAQNATNVPEVPSWLGVFINPIIGTLANICLWIVSVATTLAGFVLEWSVKFSIQNFGDIVSNTSMVNVGWTIFRDLANIVFIFLILWIAIQTILGLQHGDAMGSIMKIVIAALLINFSLFITKAVIDISNILALHFYGLITQNGEGSLGGMLLNGLKVSTFYDPSGIQNSTILTRILFSGVFGSILLLIAVWVFLAAAFLFVVRSVYLIILMILSPFAFIAWIVPGMESQTHKWWDKLFKQAFFAPIFLAMIYVIGKILQNNGLGNINNGNFMSAMDNLTTPTPNPSSVLSSTGIFLNFFLIIGMLIGALMSSSYLGAVGSTTMISWGNKIRGAGQSWAGGWIGRGARRLDERFQQSYLGNTSVGKTLREWSTIPLKEAKWGGKKSGEERYKEAEELRAVRSDIVEIKGKPLSDSDHNIAGHLKKVKETRQTGENAIADQRQEVEERKNELAKDPNNTTKQDALSKAKSDLDRIEKEHASKLNAIVNDLQRTIAKIKPHDFEELIPEEWLFDPDLVQNMTDSHLKAILEGKRLSADKKDRVRMADNADYIKAIDKIEKELTPQYNKASEKYLKDMQVFNANHLPDIADGIKNNTLQNVTNEMSTEMQKLFTEANQALSSGDTKKLEETRRDIKQMVYEYSSANSEYLKTTGINGVSIEIPLEPKKPNGLGSVDPNLRNRIRASSDYRLDQLYQIDPNRALSSPFVMTAKSSWAQHMRNDEKVPMGDRDKIRDQKFGDMGDAQDLLSGFGELKPSFDTLNKILSDLKTGIKLDQTTYDNLTHEDWKNMKESTLRPAVKRIGLEGNFEDYLSQFNDEQKAMYIWGTKKMVSAIGGKNPAELTMMRGWMWRNPVFARAVDRGIAQKFSDKDTGNISEVMTMVLHDLDQYIKSVKSNGPAIRLSKANLDLLSWITNDRVGKTFKNRDNISPKLQPTFDKMLTIFGGIGNITPQTITQIENNIKTLP